MTEWWHWVLLISFLALCIWVAGRYGDGPGPHDAGWFDGDDGGWFD